jgi:AraC-like DNA-binding protein
MWRVIRKAGRSPGMRMTGKSIGEVAHSVGYESSAAFRTAFKQRFGVSPSSYG